MSRAWPDMAVMREAQRVGAVLVDQLQRVERRCPWTCDIFLPFGVADQGVDEDALERDLAHEVQAQHHHPGDPEEDDVEAGDQDVGRVEARRGRRSSPASRGSRTARAPRRTRCRGRPRPGAAARRGRRARGPAPGRVLGLLDEDRPVGAVPGRDAVAPPELARDAPGLDVPHPLEVGLLPVLRDEDGVALLHRLDRRLGQGLGVHVPLVGQVGLDDRRRSGRRAARRGGSSRSRAAGPAPPSRATTCLRAAKRSRPRYSPGTLSFSRREVVEDVDHRQVVALADLEVVEVVGRRDLHRAGALLRVGVFVGDDRDQPVDDRQPHLLADQGRVALVVGMHGDGGVAEHGLGPGGGDDDLARSRPPADRRSASSWPSTSRCSTSRSEMAVWKCGSQFTSRLSR